MATETSGIEDLKDQCTRALREYIQQAQRTCELLESITLLPAPEATRELLTGQRIAENKARVNYDRVRSQFFDALRER